MSDTQTQNAPLTAFGELLEKEFRPLPKEGDVIKGTVLSVDKGEVHLDIGGVAGGVIRGPQLYQESSLYTNIKPGDEVEATILEIENENGEMELSFRAAGNARAWDTARDLVKSGKVVEVKVRDANRGGLLVTVEGLPAFLPVSQLNAEHYPKIAGGEKQKIMEKLKELVGVTMTVKAIDVDEQERKLIVSEKAIVEDVQRASAAAFNVGDVVEGTVSAITSFGAFVKLENVEGLVHISEIAWQRIDHPRDVLKVGDAVKAQVIQIEGAKIFLSIKRLTPDPWLNVHERYQVGQKVMGRVLKINPFGLFVELDPEIHGLAHVSELSDKPVTDISTIAKPGDIMEFEIVSIDPGEHRLGLKVPGVKGLPRVAKIQSAIVESATGENTAAVSAVETNAANAPAVPTGAASKEELLAEAEKAVEKYV
ncbi:MAG: hypothetical protein HW383_626 [Candidatus Magasanikbacteria bacterium]|nr:hypothetical protein [Candidatus Magasanikbacteria bacterium]